MASESRPETASTKVNPASMTVEEAARMLSAAGNRKITLEEIQADLDDGAPVGADGRISLVHYAAWLAREVQTR